MILVWNLQCMVLFLPGLLLTATKSWHLVLFMEGREMNSLVKPTILKWVVVALIVHPKKIAKHTSIRDVKIINCQNQGWEFSENPQIFSGVSESFLCLLCSLLRYFHLLTGELNSSVMTRQPSLQSGRNVVWATSKSWGTYTEERVASSWGAKRHSKSAPITMVTPAFLHGIFLISWFSLFFSS